MADLVSKSKNSDVEFNVETVCGKHEKVACFFFFFFTICGLVAMQIVRCFPHAFHSTSMCAAAQAVHKPAINSQP